MASSGSDDCVLNVKERSPQPTRLPHRLPTPDPALVLWCGSERLSLVNVELLLMQQRIAFHDDRLACEFFHLLQPARAVCF